MYWLTRFGTIALSQYDVSFSAAPAPADTAVIQLVGGGTFDSYGAGASPQRYPHQLSYRCSVLGPDAESAKANMNILKGLIGERDQLWRSMIPAGSQHWAWARLTSVNDIMTAKMPKWIAPVTLGFTLMGRWHGLKHRSPWFFDGGQVFDNGLAFNSDEEYTLTGSQTIWLDNDGKQTIRDPVIVVTAGSNPITYLKIAVAGVSEFEYTGTIAANQVLTIDCENKSVINNLANGWNEFALTANHKVADWLILPPLSTELTVTSTFTAGGATAPKIEFRYSDGWA